jgi:hypothetical protein
MKKLFLGLIIAASVFTIVSCRHNKENTIELPTTVGNNLTTFTCTTYLFDSVMNGFYDVRVTKVSSWKVNKETKAHAIKECTQYDNVKYIDDHAFITRTMVW